MKYRLSALSVDGRQSTLSAVRWALAVLAALTQLVEYLTRNEKVAGSNPAGGS